MEDLTGVGKDLVETHQHENEVIPKFKEKLYKDISKFLEKHQEYQKKKSMLDVLQGVGGVGENPAAIQNPSAVASTFGTDMSQPSAVPQEQIAPAPKVIQGISPNAVNNIMPTTPTEAMIGNEQLQATVGTPEQQKEALLRLGGWQTGAKTGKSGMDNVEITTNADIIENDPFNAYGIFGRMGVYGRQDVTNELARRGTVLPSDKVYNTYMDTINNASGGLNSLKQIAGMADGLMTEKDWAGAWGAGILDWVGGKVKSNIESASYIKSLGASLPLMARSLGNTGVLTELDVQKVSEALPVLTDSWPLAQKKLSNIKTLIAGKLEAAENNFYSQLKLRGKEVPRESRRKLIDFGQGAPVTKPEPEKKEEKKKERKVIRTFTNKEGTKKKVTYDDGTEVIIPLSK